MDVTTKIGTLVRGRFDPGETVRARIVPTSAHDGREEPAGVGLCLSGGGSRAMTAGLGQLRALHHLKFDGEPLLSRVAAISTVSGGSWLGVPWTFLPTSVSDEDFLGGYVGDPARLVYEPRAGHSQAETLDEIGAHNPGANLGEDFSIADMLIDVVALRFVHRTPYNMMWQILMGRRLLEPYGLYEADDHAEPTSMFTADEATRERYIVDPNPEFADRTINLCHPGRPELICNTALFVDTPASQFEFLAPVQITPTRAGVISSPSDVTAAKAPVGGGTVSAFAFGSALDHLDGDAVRVLQERQLALADIVGMSSAAFAEFVQDFDAAPLAEIKREHRKELRRRMRVERSLGEHPRRLGLLTRLLDDIKAFVMHFVLRRLDPKQFVPRYRYWPVRDATPNPGVAESLFADGGSLENTGIASMLTRPNIGHVVACVNSPDKLEQVSLGIIDVTEHGKVTEVPGTGVKVSSELPFLFGYRAHNHNVGYVKFGNTPDDDLGSDLMFKNNQVFESEDFKNLLVGLAEASSSAGNDDLSTHPAIFRQQLTTVENPWFGVSGGRCVTVVWVYLNDSSRWRGQVSDEVERVVEATVKFPNYSTEHTELSVTEVNLLSHFTAWSVANDGNCDTFIELFREAASSK